MSVMIDWLTLKVPCALDGRLDGGRICSITPAGDVEWESPKRLPVEGSHSARIMVRGGGSGELGTLEISGNPAKWLQGHNLFGSSSVRWLGYHLIAGVVRTLGLPHTLEDRRCWWRGEYDVLRVDVTRMYDLGDPKRVVKFLGAAYPLVHSKYQKASAERGGTIYVGKHSRRVSLKMYEKYGELLTRGHELPETLTPLQHRRLMDFAYGKLRVELTLRSKELEERGLRRASAWRGGVAEAALDGFLSRLQMGDTMMLSEDVCASLPRAMQFVYDAWRAGRNIAAMYTKKDGTPSSTFFRYRQRFLELGIDLYVINPRALVTETETLFGAPVPMRDLISGPGVAVPLWARGTDLYSDARAA